MALRTVSGPAGPIHVDDGGTGGLPVVFVHSYAGSSDHWGAQLAHLRPERRAIAMDLRGHGRSAAPRDGDYAIESLAEDLAAVVNELDLWRFVLVGHSIGGAVIASYAGTHPDRVAGLLMVGPPGHVPRPQAREIMESLRNDWDRVSAAYWDQLLQGARSDVRETVLEGAQAMDREAGLALIQATFEDDPLIGLRRFHGPTMIVATPHGNTPHDLQNLRPDIPYKLVIGTSHWIQMDKPEEFNRILDTFLARMGQLVGAPA